MPAGHPDESGLQLDAHTKARFAQITNKILGPALYFAGNPPANCGASCVTGFDFTGSEAPFLVIASS